MFRSRTAAALVTAVAGGALALFAAGPATAAVVTPAETCGNYSAPEGNGTAYFYHSCDPNYDFNLNVYLDWNGDTTRLDHKDCVEPSGTTRLGWAPSDAMPSYGYHAELGGRHCHA